MRILQFVKTIIVMCLICAIGLISANSMRNRRSTLSKITNSSENFTLPYSSLKSFGSINDNIYDTKFKYSCIENAGILSRPEFLNNDRLKKYFSRREINVIKTEDFPPLNALLIKYTPFEFNEIYMKTFSTLHSCINQLCQIDKVNHLKIPVIPVEIQQSTLIKLHDMKKHIENLKTTGCPIYSEPDIPVFTNTDIMLYHKVLNGNNLFRTYTINENIELKVIKCKVEEMHKKYINLRAKMCTFKTDINKEMFLNNKDSNEYYNCMGLFRYIRDNKSVLDERFKTNNYYTFICDLDMIILSLEKLQNILKSKLFIEKTYEFGDILNMKAPTYYAIYSTKLFLYLYRHLYAFNIIISQFDGLYSVDSLNSF